MKYQINVKHFVDKVLRNCEKCHTFVNSSSSSNKSKLGLQSSGIQLKDKYRHFPTYTVSNYAISDIRSFKQSNVTRYIYNLKKKARITFLARMEVCKMKMAEKKWQWDGHTAADQV